MLLKLKIFQIKNFFIIKRKKIKWTNEIFDILLVLYLFSHVAFGWNMSYTRERNIITLSFLVYAGYYCITQRLLGGNSTIKVSWQSICFAFFIILSFISVIWSFDKSTTLSSTFTLILNFGIAFMIQQRMENKEDVDNVIRAFIFSATMNALYIIYVTPVTDGVTRMGISEEFGNIINILANQSAIAFFLCIYYIFNLHLIGKKWLLYIFPEIVLLYTVIRCGSKMGVLLLLMGTIIFLYTYSGVKMRAFYIMIIPVAIGVLIYAVNEIEMLNILFYDSFTSLINQLLGRKGYIDISTRDRSGMINVGIGLWLSRPLFGWGTSCFSKIAPFGGMYSHNSYIEILCGLGLAGFLLYYIYPFINLFRLKRINKKKCAERSIAFSLIVCMLFRHIGNASYIAVYDFALLIIVNKIVGIETRKNPLRREVYGW